MSEGSAGLNEVAVVIGRRSDTPEGENAGPDISGLAEWMSRMEVTRPEILRATHCHCLLRGCGHVLRKPWPRDFYKMSFTVEEIGQFLSHSWHGNRAWKAMLLILIKNGMYACVWGTLAALIMAVLVFYQLLPDMSKLAVLDSDVAEPTSIWALTTGMVVSIATLIWRRPQQTVFLDNVCIDQSSAFTKAEGIANMGGFLRRSNSMLVLWDSTYVERLWCIFEMAGFLHSRALRASSNSLTQPVDIRPTWAAPSTVAIGVSLFGAMLALLIVPFTNPIVGSSLFGLLAIICFHVAAESVRNYHRCIDKMQLQLKNFDIQQARCFCCTVDHLDSSSSEPMVCDREIITRCICQWFGSIDAFHECVHSQIFTNLTEQLLNQPFPVWWLIGASVPILWGELDAVAVQLRLGNVDVAADWGIKGLMWWLAGFPLSFLCWSRFCRYWRGRTRCDWLVNLLGTCLVVGVMTLLWVCNFALSAVMRNDVLGSAIFLCLMVLINSLLWNICRWRAQNQNQAWSSRHQIC